MPLGTLPPKAARMWEDVYESAYERTGDKSRAAKQAWGATKKHYYKKGKRWRKRKRNVDIDEVAAAGAQYRKAVRQHADALESGEGTSAAIRDVKLARKELRQSLSPGIPLTVASAGVGAALGALVGRSIGAAIGALIGGSAPTVIKVLATRRSENG